MVVQRKLSSFRDAPAAGSIGVFQEESEVPAAGLSQVRMTLRGYGYDGALLPVTPVTPVAVKNRIEYRRGDLLEWYVNDEHGLEQGFTLMARPAPTGIGLPSPRGEGQGEGKGSIGQSKRVGVVGSVVPPHPSPTAIELSSDFRGPFSYS